MRNAIIYGSGILTGAIVVILIACFVLTTARPKHQVELPDLIFSGTITDISIAGNSDSRKKYKITTAVDRVISGPDGIKVFEFYIHSPSISRLEVGKTCNVVVHNSKDGYTVDENQWIKAVIPLSNLSNDA
jgi:hypothetical protein